jgi:ABA4-like protein
MERIFALSSVLVLPFWLLMILAPRWRWTRRLVSSPFIVAGPLALYAALVVPDLLALLPAVARPELPAIAALLGQPRGATIAWAHFLALDLFAARWMFLDASERGLSRWLLSPLLLLTLLFGPLGLAAYLVLKAGLSSPKAGALTRQVPAAARQLSAAVGGLARQVWAGNRPLALLTLGSGLLLVASMALQLVDGRQVLGAPVWLKPAKFGLSVALAAPVLAWIIGQMASRRGLRRAAAVMTATLTLELVIITVQAARGVASHFNSTTAVEATLFGVMGAAITVFWVAQAYLALRAFRHTFASPARTWAIRLGLAATLLGGAVGFLMPRPTPAQLASLRAGQPTTEIGAHGVGVPDGGPGLPGTRWSTEGGDLRVPHFIGLHALQVLPLLAVWFERRRRGGAPARPVVAAGVAWIGLVAVTLWQALRGQPVIAPDAATLAAAALVALAALAVTWRPSAAAWRAWSPGSGRLAP